ncbi:hypothetical protein BKA93DRAFT_51799 [Sparassis latifolia]
MIPKPTVLLAHLSSSSLLSPWLSAPVITYCIYCADLLLLISWQNWQSNRYYLLPLSISDLFLKLVIITTTTVYQDSHVYMHCWSLDLPLIELTTVGTVGADGQV